MAEGAAKAEATIEKEENVEEITRYVLHGGIAYCKYGSRTSRLQMPECKGTYMHDMPIMTEEDYTVEKCVQPFGFCTCESNLERQEAIQDIMQAVEDESGIADTIMDGVNAVGGFFKKVKEFFCGSEEEKKEESEELAILKQNIMIPCHPIFNHKWSDASDDLLIKGKKALTTKCTLYCEKCGVEDAIIRIIDDGQENAANEQSKTQDMSQWKEGDPMPELTAGNLQQLEEMGQEDSDLYKEMKTAMEAKESLAMQKRCCESEEDPEYKRLEKLEKQMLTKYENRESIDDELNQIYNTEEQEEE